MSRTGSTCASSPFALDDSLHLIEHAVQIIENLAIEESKDAPTLRHEGVLPVSILLESLTTSVVGEAVEFDNQAGLCNDNVGPVPTAWNQPSNLTAHSLGAEPLTNRLVENGLRIDTMPACSSGGHARRRDGRSIALANPPPAHSLCRRNTQACSSAHPCAFSSPALGRHEQGLRVEGTLSDRSIVSPVGIVAKRSCCVKPPRCVPGAPGKGDGTLRRSADGPPGCRRSRIAWPRRTDP